jgi:hypothetical protein
MSTVCTFHNAEVVVDDLGQGGEAVGGAGGVRHHVVARLVLLVVHTLKMHLYQLKLSSSVVVDPDVRLRIRTSISSESGFGSGVLMTKNQNKKSWIFCFLIKLQKRHPRNTSKLQEKPSALKREHLALTVLYFSGPFCPLGSESGL